MSWLASAQYRSDTSVTLWARPFKLNSMLCTVGYTFQNGRLHAHPGLAVCPRDVLLFVESFTPVGDFAQRIRHDLDGTQLQRQVDFLARGEAAAFRLHRGLFPRQVLPARSVLRILK